MIAPREILICLLREKPVDCNCNQCQPSRYTWQDPQEEPGPWSTLMVILAVLALAAAILWR